MCLTHPQTIPPLPRLPRNWSLVPRRMGPTDVRNSTHAALWLILEGDDLNYQLSLPLPLGRACWSSTPGPCPQFNLYSPHANYQGEEKAGGQSQRFGC